MGSAVKAVYSYIRSSPKLLQAAIQRWFALGLECACSGVWAGPSMTAPPILQISVYSRRLKKRNLRW
jgi:hypothetical protein